MDELLGGHIETEAFDRFLLNWKDELRNRSTIACREISRIAGVDQLILAGSVGRGQPWPLSDIDIIPIYFDTHVDAARHDMELVRLHLLERWQYYGWRTGVDVGNLYFTTGELERAIDSGVPMVETLLVDNRWYHSIDKAYGGRVMFGDGRGSVELLGWIQNHRFSDAVVSARLQRSMTESLLSIDAALEQAQRGRSAASYSSLLKAVNWLQVHLMESWGERDNSQGRFGTRFEQASSQRGFESIADALNQLCSLTEESVATRMKCAPWWVLERNDRTWRSRLAIAEHVTLEQSDRDVLRVSTVYELRSSSCDEHADWLAVPPLTELAVRVQRLRDVVAELVPSLRSRH